MPVRPERLIPDASDRGRVNNLDAVRLIMALMVVWSHSFAIYLGTEDNEPLSLLTHGHFNSGNVGVLGFFAISGYLISESFARSSSLRSFLLKRVRRIYPGFIAACLIGTLAIAPFFVDHRAPLLAPQSVVHTLGNALVLHTYEPDGVTFFPANPRHALNGALWSIPFEFWCYIGVMILGVVGLRNRAWFIVSLLGGTILLRIGLDVLGRQPGLGLIGDIFGWPYLWTTVLPPFLCGMALNILRDRIPRDWRILAALLTGFVGLAWLPAPYGDLGTRAACPFVITYAVFYAGYARQAILPGLTGKQDISYGTYLYAFPIQQAFRSLFGTALPFVLYVVLCLAASMAAGWLSWQLVERHFLAPSRRKGHSGARHDPLQVNPGWSQS